jgi:copper chaperone
MHGSTRTPLPMATTGCACCAPAAESTAATPGQASGGTGAPAPAAASTYRVQGMTCAHCVVSVTEELSGLDGVTAVDVDLVPGGISTVTVTGPVAPAAARAAIEEAGYTPVS